MKKYRVIFEGKDANDKPFSDFDDVDAEDREDAQIKAHKAFMIPGPQGKSFKYCVGPNAAVHWIAGVIQLD